VNDFFERVGTQVNESHPGAIQAEPSTPTTYPTDGMRKAIAFGQIAHRRWSQADDLFWPASETCERLEPAFYRFDNLPNIGPCLRRAVITTDGLIHLPDTVGERVVDEFKTFWSIRDKFTERGFIHKRGILLWGPPGSGKTCSLMLMAQEIVERQKGIVVQIDQPELAAVCLGFIRKIEPERPIVAMIEDLDALVQRHGENNFLALLDGETQVDRICYVATTNYPERLDRRFVDRPSRFDTVEFIGMPTPAARRVYLRAKEPSLTDIELERWVKDTEGFSVAHLRELIILVRCFERPLEKAIERLEGMRMRRPDSDRAPDRPQFGIVGR
jgi:SpoVK/Ycf46/Vps4 family AAA+-type ATPase